MRGAHLIVTAGPEQKAMTELLLLVMVFYYNNSRKKKQAAQNAFPFKFIMVTTTFICARRVMHVSLSCSPFTKGHSEREL